MPRQANDLDWSDLLTSIRQNDCVLILGPNLAAAASPDGQQVPLIQQFSRQLAALLQADKVTDASNLSHVAEVYFRETQNVTRLRAALKAFYSRDWPLPAAHAALAKLPFRLIINAAPDCSISRALGPMDHGRAMYDFNAPPVDPGYSPHDPRPFVYNLFGNFEEPASVVITESDRVEFIQKVVQKEHKIPDSIQNVLRQSKNYLFLGFDFADWHMRLLLSVLNPKDEVKIPTSFALNDGGSPLSGPAEVFFGKRFKLNFFEGGADEFTGELLKRWQGEAGQPAAKPAGAAGKKAVLLFAENEDKAFLEQAAPLEKSGAIQIEKVQPGDDVFSKNTALLDGAGLAIALVSSKFLNEQFDLWEQKLAPMHAAGKLDVVPVLLDSCLFDMLPGIERMPILPRNKTAVNSHASPAEAWAHIMAELRGIVN